MAEIKQNYYCSNYVPNNQYMDPDVSCWITYIHPVHKIWKKTDSNEGIKPFQGLNYFEYTQKTFNQDTTQNVQPVKFANEGDRNTDVCSDIDLKSITTLSQNPFNSSTSADVKRTENCLDLYVKMVELKLNNRLDKCKTLYQLHRLNSKNINRRDHDCKTLRKSSRLQKKRKSREEEKYSMIYSEDKKLLSNKKVNNTINKNNLSLRYQPTKMSTTALTIPRTRIPDRGRYANKDRSGLNTKESLSRIQRRNKSNFIKESSSGNSKTRATDSFLRREGNVYVSKDALFKTKTSESVQKISGVLYRVTPIYFHSYDLRPLESRILRYPLILEKLK
ncbi:hypothetical protein J6590_056848 [Homalodisca vitripennis]|nr:hypothetical protein J6590_056848 [Homalodisca vitripennis]